MNWPKIKNIYNKSCEVAQQVVYSDVYIACVCVLTFLLWYLNNMLVGFAVICVLATLTLLFTRNAAAFFVPIVCLLMVVRDLSATPVIPLIPFFLLVLIGVVVFAVRNHPNTFNLGRMFWPQVAVSVALLLGGIGAISAENYFRAFPLVLALSLGVLAIYVLFINFLKTDDVDVPLHFAKVFAYVGFVVSAELFTVIMQSGRSPSEWIECYWDVGWGNRNMIATYLNFCIIMCLYLCTRAKKFGFVYMLAAFVQTLFLVLTMSRGGILFGGIAIIVGVVMCILKGNRKELLICLGATFATAVFVATIFHRQVGALFSGALERFAEISIRFENGKLVIEGTSWRGGEDGLYQKALELFKAHPLLGGGVGHVVVKESVDGVTMDWFHSTIFEVMASMGILGILCYGFYYLVRFGNIFYKGRIKNKFPLFVFITWIAFEGQSLLDVGILEPVYMIFIALQMVIVEICVGQRYEQQLQTYWLYKQPKLPELPMEVVAEESPVTAEATQEELQEQPQENN